jgi:GMP synthase-like glutamine amidotransferase
VYAGFAEGKRAVQWHGAEVCELPPGATLLASTAGCPNTAFAVGSAAFGIQYHVEAHTELVGEWAATPGGHAMLEQANGPGASPRILDETSLAMPELRGNVNRFYANFMQIARRSGT